MRLLSAFLSALIFGFGLGFSGMTDPQKVQGFLDVFGAWKADLIFVMMGAVTTHAVLYFFIIKIKKPLYADFFQIPTNKKIDLKLVSGSALFGFGWGLAGYCPGPAVASLFTFHKPVLVFIISMFFGMFFYHSFFKVFVLKEKS
jgi:uncharacterized membrane protein YedE/YeeE